MTKLAEYEDTGLVLEEIKDITAQTGSAWCFGGVFIVIGMVEVI